MHGARSLAHQLVGDLPAVGHGPLGADLLGDGLAVPAALLALAVAGLVTVGRLALVDVGRAAVLLVLGGAAFLSKKNYCNLSYEQGLHFCLKSGNLLAYFM